MYGKQMIFQSNELNHVSLKDDPCSRLPATQ